MKQQLLFLLNVKQTLKKLSCCLLLFVGQMMFSQNSFEIDFTFNPSDVGFGIGDGTNERIYPNDEVFATALQADGKIIIVGKFISFNNVARPRIARLNADGSLDNTFNMGVGANDLINCIVLQPDGKILIGGDFTTFNNVARNHIARLNTDGSLDTTFAVGNGANDDIKSIALQSDGKVLVGGVFTSFNGVARNSLARLNSNGSLDTTFSSGIIETPENTVFAVTLQSDGKILVGGHFSIIEPYSRYIYRLNPDGSVDTSFSGLGPNDTVYSIAVLPDNKILVGGYFTGNHPTTRYGIDRLNSDGSVDNNFDNGSGADNGVLSITLQPDGKILIAGDFTSYNGVVRNRIARLNSNGSLDFSFNTNGGPDNVVYSSVLLPDGKMFIGGAFELYNGTARNRIVLLNSDGSFDPSFNPSYGANQRVNTIAVQPDGKIVLGGQFTAYNDVAVKRIVRINVDGTKDVSFNCNTSTMPTPVNSLVLQPDGKLIVAASFNFNGTLRNGIARLNTDGSLDTSFNPGSGAIGTIYSVVVQPDGKILIGGDFTYYNGVARNRIARLNADGSLDNSFNLQGISLSNAVKCIVLQPDGKILIGGTFSRVTGASRNGIARLHSNGLLDSSIDSGTINTEIFEVSSIVLQPDGKIVLAGWFSNCNGVARNSIARINADGSLDNTFGTVSGYMNLNYSSIFLQSDGKILAAVKNNSNSAVSINRLNSDGSLDVSGMVVNNENSDFGSIKCIALQSDNKILIGGQFTSCNGIGRSRIARLHNVNTVLGVENNSLQEVKIYPNPVKNVLHFEMPESTMIKNYSVYDLLGKQVVSKNESVNAINVSNLTNGIYILKIQTNEGELIKKFIKE